MLLGVLSYWALVDFPEKAHKSWKFITQRESQFIIDRVNKDRGDATPEPFNAGKFFRAGLDPKIWGFAMVSAVTCAGSDNLLTGVDILQHDDRHVCFGVFLTHNPKCEHEVLRRSFPVFR